MSKQELREACLVAGMDERLVKGMTVHHAQEHEDVNRVFRFEVTIKFEETTDIITGAVGFVGDQILSSMSRIRIDEGEILQDREFYFLVNEFKMNRAVNSVNIAGAIIAAEFEDVELD